jgi:hypothetical protein
MRTKTQAKSSSNVRSPKCKAIHCIFNAQETSGKNRKSSSNSPRRVLPHREVKSKKHSTNKRSPKKQMPCLQIELPKKYTLQELAHNAYAWYFESKYVWVLQENDKGEHKRWKARIAIEKSGGTKMRVMCDGHKNFQE